MTVRLPRAELLAIGGAALLMLALYLLTMPPGLTWWFGGADSGDLAAAAFELGIPHPTGYPLFAALGWLATRVPLGEPAGRLNTMNALCATGAAVIAGLAVLDIARDRTSLAKIAPAVAALTVILVGSAGLFWSQAIITEVYALNALLCAAIGWQTWRYLQDRGSPLLLGLLQGLALSNHVTSIFAAAALVIALWSARRRPARTDLLSYLLGAAIGLTPYLLLPIRAAQDPSTNWGDPDTLGRFLTHVSGGQYRGFVAWTDIAGNAGRFPGLVRLLLGDVAPWAIPFAAWGVGWCWNRARAVLAFWTTLGVLCILFATVYRVPDRALYIVPAYLGYGVLAGIGVLAAVEWLWQLHQRGQALPVAWPIAAAAVVAVTSGIWALRAFATHDLRGDRTPEVFGQAVLSRSPDNAVVYTARDDVSFTLRYLQLVHGLRPDVRVVDVRAERGDATP